MQNGTLLTLNFDRHFYLKLNQFELHILYCVEKETILVNFSCLRCVLNHDL